MAMPTLDPDQEQTIALLESLLQDAREGRIDGVAIVSIVRGELDHYVDACGSAVRFPVYTLGALKTLTDELSEQHRHQKRHAATLS